MTELDSTVESYPAQVNAKLCRIRNNSKLEVGFAKFSLFAIRIDQFQFRTGRMLGDGRLDGHDPFTDV